MYAKTRLSFMMRLVLFLLCALFSVTAHAQVRQEGRFEIVQRYSDEDFTIISLNEDGLALFRKKFKFNDRNRVWELILLDSTATPKKSLELEVDNQGELMGYEHSNDFIHLLFIKNEIKGDMEVISVNLTTYEQNRTKITTELKINLTHFTKCGDNYILGGDVGEEPAVFIYIPATKNFKIIPGFFNKRTELVDVRLNNNQTFNTVLISRENRDNNKIIFRTFDSFGKQLIEDVVPFRDHNVQTGMTSNLKRDDLIILGTWGNVGASQSSGFYGVPVNPFSEQEIKYTFLGELQHYLDQTKPKRAEKIKAKTKEAIEKGGDPDFTNYIIPHRIIEHEKGFILLAETYIPSKDNYSSRTNPYAYANPYGNRYGSYYPGSGMYNTNDGRSYGNTETSLQEIRTVQSQVILFTPTGEIIADYSINLNDIKMPSLNQITDFYLDKDDLYFLYKKESELIIKKINLQDGQVSESTQKVKMKSPMDVIRSESKDTRIRHWYDKSFYMYGYQTVRHEDGKTDDIFYINRVAID
jgi:hypothetical protein